MLIKGTLQVLNVTLLGQGKRSKMNNHLSQSYPDKFVSQYLFTYLYELSPVSFKVLCFYFSDNRSHTEKNV